MKKPVKHTPDFGKISKKMYVCGVAWYWEMENTDVKMYHTVKALKADSECYKDDGIIEIKCTFVKQVHPSKERPALKRARAQYLKKKQKNSGK